MMVIQVQNLEEKWYIEHKYEKKYRLNNYDYLFFLFL